MLATLLFLMVTLAFSQIVLRNLFDSGFIWGEPVLRVLVMWLGLGGALVATRENNHISVDAVLRLLGPSTRLLAQTLTQFLTAGVCAVLAYHGTRMVMMDYEYGGTLVPLVPTWVAELIIPLAFGIMALRFLAHSSVSLRHALHPTEAEQ
jgi:TRAP-type C4-dicarboxylate transport system permease small subunit